MASANDNDTLQVRAPRWLLPSVVGVLVGAGGGGATAYVSGVAVSPAHAQAGITAAEARSLVEAAEVRARDQAIVAARQHADAALAPLVQQVRDVDQRLTKIDAAMTRIDDRLFVIQGMLGSRGAGRTMK